MPERKWTTGLPGVDRVFRGLMPGDNVVWQVDSLDDFRPFVVPFCQAAADGRKARLFPFRRPRAARAGIVGAIVHRLRPEERIRAIHRGPASGHRSGGHWGDVRLRFALDAGRGVVQRSDARQFLPADRPGPAPAAIAGLLSACFATAIRFTPRRPSARRRKFSSMSTGATEKRTSIRKKCKGAIRPRCTCCIAGTANCSAPCGQLDHGRHPHRAALGRLESIRLRLGPWTRTFLQAEECWEGVKAAERPPEDADGNWPKLLHMAISRDQRIAT